MNDDLTGNQEKRRPRGSVETAAGPRFLVIGEVRKPHGVRGEIRVTPHTDVPERFHWLETIYIGTDEPRSVAVEGVRFHRETVLLKLAGYDDRDTADTLRGLLLQVPIDEAIPLEEGEYYIYQLIGLSVVTDSGELLGELSEVIETGANNVFLVLGDRGEILIPDISEVIQDINFDIRQMIVRLLPGLMPD